MKICLSSLLMSLFFVPLAHAEMGNCWGNTAPTAEQYLAKLKTGDSCEVRRVPMACEMNVINAALKRQASGFYLSSVEMNEESPLTTIDLTFMNSRYSTKNGTVKVKYDTNILGDCKIISIKIESKSCPDVGC